MTWLKLPNGYRTEKKTLPYLNGKKDFCHTKSQSELYEEASKLLKEKSFKRKKKY